MSCSLVVNNQDDTAAYSSVQTKALFDFANILPCLERPNIALACKPGLIPNALIRRERMRRILISALTPLILAIPALAQNLPPDFRDICSQCLLGHAASPGRFAAIALSRLFALDLVGADQPL